MTCCNPILIPFINESVTTIPYVGNKPMVTVSYFVDEVWYVLGVVASIIVNATDIVVDHGGASTGVIKIMQ